MTEKVAKAPKTEAKTTEVKTEPKAPSNAAAESKVDTPKDADTSKSDAPKNYSRGEGQKAVTQAYKDNWNAIFGKKKRS
jgi:hypothetical protein